MLAMDPDVAETLAAAALPQTSLSSVGFGFNQNVRKGGQVKNCVWLLLGGSLGSAGGKVARQIHRLCLAMGRMVRCGAVQWEEAIPLK
jgi:hypothetical protein